MGLPFPPLLTMIEIFIVAFVIALVLDIMSDGKWRKD